MSVRCRQAPAGPDPWSRPQDDEVVLQCSATVLKEQLKLCLAAEGFGNRLCFLEPTSNAQVCSQGGRGQGTRGSEGAQSLGFKEQGSRGLKRGC